MSPNSSDNAPGKATENTSEDALSVAGFPGTRIPTDRMVHPAGSPVSGTALSAVAAFLFLCATLTALAVLIPAHSRLVGVVHEKTLLLDTALLLERTVYETAHHAAQYAVSGDMRHYSGVRIRLAYLRDGMDALENETRRVPGIPATVAETLNALRAEVRETDASVEERRSATEHLSLARSTLTAYSQRLRERAGQIISSPGAAKEDIRAAALFALAAERITGVAVSTIHVPLAQEGGFAELAQELAARWGEAQNLSPAARKAATARDTRPGHAASPVRPEHRPKNSDPKSSLVEAWAEIADIAGQYGTLLLSLSALVRQQNVTLEERERKADALALSARGLTDVLCKELVYGARADLAGVRTALAGLAVAALLSLGLCVYLAGWAVRVARTRRGDGPERTGGVR